MKLCWSMQSRKDKPRPFFWSSPIERLWSGFARLMAKAKDPPLGLYFLLLLGCFLLPYFLWSGDWLELNALCLGLLVLAGLGIARWRVFALLFGLLFLATQADYLSNRIRHAGDQQSYLQSLQTLEPKQSLKPPKLDKTGQTPLVNEPIAQTYEPTTEGPSQDELSSEIQPPEPAQKTEDRPAKLPPPATNKASDLNQARQNLAKENLNEVAGFRTKTLLPNQADDLTRYLLSPEADQIRTDRLLHATAPSIPSSDSLSSNDRTTTNQSDKNNQTSSPKSSAAAINAPVKTSTTKSSSASSAPAGKALASSSNKETPANLKGLEPLKASSISRENQLKNPNSRQTTDFLSTRRQGLKNRFKQARAEQCLALR